MLSLFIRSNVSGKQNVPEEPKTDSFGFERISRYTGGYSGAASLQRIGERTLLDIDFRTVFTYVDPTRTKAGQQFSCQPGFLLITKSLAFDRHNIVKIVGDRFSGVNIAYIHRICVLESV